MTAIWGVLGCPCHIVHSQSMQEALQMPMLNSCADASVTCLFVLRMAWCDKDPQIAVCSLSLLLKQSRLLGYQ